MRAPAAQVFQTRSTPLALGRARLADLRRSLQKVRPGIPKVGLHAFRHSRVTQLRNVGTPQELQKQWIDHTSFRTGDRYRHTHEEVEYRRPAARNVGLDRALRPQAVPMRNPDLPVRARSKTNY